MAFILPVLLPLVPVLAFLMILIIMITYVGGKAFGIPQLEAYLNVELHNLFMAFIILGAIIGFYWFSLSLTASLLPQCQSMPSCQPADVAQGFLNNVVNKGVLPMYKDLLAIEAGTAMSNSYMIRVGPGVWSFVYKVEPGADAILSMARMLSFGLLVIYGSLSMQYIMLSFVEFGAPIAISIGLILFIFPPTRDSGAFLIAFAFAFQTVFPFLYALDEAALNDMWSAHGWGPTYDAYVPELFGLRVRGVSTVLAYLVPFASLANFELLVPFINAMAHLALIALFLPALTMMITIAFINATTKYIMGKT